MSELKSILSALDGAMSSNRSAVLASIVSVQGSSYRSPGARMLIIPGSARSGIITGPCLESELERQAALLTPTNPTRLLTYDTTDQKDVLFGYGLGCGGIIRILLEYIDPKSPPQYIPCLRDAVDSDAAAALATLYSAAGPVIPRIYTTGDVFHAFGDWPPELAAIVLADARGALRAGKALAHKYNDAEVLIEIIRPSLHLVIIGAGDGAIPLVRLARELGWRITVLDRRPAFAQPARFPQADAVMTCPIGQIAQNVKLTSRCAAVIMTHNYGDDLELLRILLASPAAYIGLLGSRSRSQRLLADLTKDGPGVTSEQLTRLHAPMGLDIGAETSPEIALAVLAEIQAHFSSRSGMRLRDSVNPIHDRNGVSCPAGDR